MPAPNPQDTPFSREVAKWERAGYEFNDAVVKAIERWPDARTVVFFLYNRPARTAFTKLARAMILVDRAVDYYYKSREEAEGDPRGYLVMRDRHTPVDWDLWGVLVEQHGAREEVYDDDYLPLPEPKQEQKEEQIVLRKLPRAATADGVCGLCFTWALREVTTRGGILVHGIVTSPLSDPPETYAHAWVERKGMVYDWQTMEEGHGGKWARKGYPAKLFYELYQPTDTRRYTALEANEQALVHGHHGPWLNENPRRRRPRKNPTWTLDGETVDTDHGPDGWEYTWKKGRVSGPFPTEHAAIKDALRRVAEGAKPIAIIGDVNPIVNDGGIIYQSGDPPRYRVVYFRSFVCGDENRVTVYDFDILPDVVQDLDWADWQAVADYVGESVDTIKKLARSSDPVERALVYEMVGSYDGFGNIDHESEEMTLEDAEAEYGKDVDRVHEAERRKRNPIGEMRRRRKQGETRRERFYRLLRRM